MNVEPMNTSNHLILIWYKTIYIRLQSNNCNVLDNECRAYKCIKLFNIDMIQNYLH